jgi:tRNA-uridine 2-sulfurtransferase
MATIAVAMSGGVDSSAAAALLKNADHDLIGFSMQLWDQRRRRGPSGEPLESRCCSLDDLYDARSVADRIGIPFYVVNLEEAFERSVVRPFVEAYLDGETPIPCVACNTRLKFAQLLAMARKVGASAVATGHYARVRFDESRDRWILSKAKHLAKDQTYFLFELTQAQLARSVFPLGEMSKAEVRDVARASGLPTSEKAESQEICFIPDNDYSAFIRDYLTEKGELDRLPAAGEIVDADGNVVGAHAGTHRFTVGQRKGIGLAAAEPLYVVQIQPSRRRVIAGPVQALLKRELVARECNWISVAEPSSPIRAGARVRYRAPDAPATIESLGYGRARVTFDDPQRAITPGQAVVFYDGDHVVGGGWIEAEPDDR